MVSIDVSKMGMTELILGDWVDLRPESNGL